MGYKQCSKCGKTLPLDQFSKRAASKDGLQPYCRECNKEKLKRHYKNNNQMYVDRNRKNKAKVRQWVRDYKADLKCQTCDEDDPACLDFHHLDPSEKEINISTVIGCGWSVERLKIEIEKCIVLCANCHRKLHYYENNAE